MKLFGRQMNFFAGFFFHFFRRTKTESESIIKYRAPTRIVLQFRYTATMSAAKYDDTHLLESVQEVVINLTVEPIEIPPAPALKSSARVAGYHPDGLAEVDALAFSFGRSNKLNRSVNTPNWP
jgi:hypothetical protein